MTQHNESQREGEPQAEQRENTPAAVVPERSTTEEATTPTGEPINNEKGPIFED